MRRLFDSKDLQDFVEKINYQFTPAEEVVLISLTNAPLNEKLKLYKEYVNTYTDEAFLAEGTAVINWADCDNHCGFREMLIKIINQYEIVLSDMDKSKGYVFSAAFNETGFKCKPYILFSDYEAAYQFLLDEKNEYLTDEDLKEVKTHGEIKRIPVNNRGAICCSYDQIIYDDNLEIVDIVMSDEYRKDFSISLTESIYIHIPLPFKAGDIVKSISKNGDGENIYGVIKHDSIISREDDIWLKNNCCIDGADIVVDLDRYDICHKHYFLQHSVPKVSLVYADETEICNENERKWLQRVSAVNSGKENLIWLLMDLR